MRHGRTRLVAAAVLRYPGKALRYRPRNSAIITAEAYHQQEATVAKARKRSYWALVARPIIQTALIDVSADSEEEATERALSKAIDLPEERWTGRLGPDDYSYDVLGVLPKGTLEPGETAEEVVGGLTEDTKYLLLKGNLNVGVGEMVLQPWIREASPLVLADLCDVWQEELNAFQEDQKEGLDSWLQTIADLAKKTRPRNVVPLFSYWWKKRRKKIPG